MYARWIAVLLLAVAAGWLLPGCDGGGIETKAPDIGDSPPTPSPPGNGDDDDDDDGPAPGEPRFDGPFITSYGDDFTSAAASSPSEYAARIVLEQQGSTITGTGAMARYFRTGPFSNARFEFTVAGSGTLGGNDGRLRFQNRANRNDFDRIPRWVLRRAGSRLVGIYGEFNENDQLVRSGHAVWTRQQEGSLNETWVTTEADSFAVEALEPLSRTTRLVLSTPSGNAVEGSGGFTEHPLFDDVLATNFTVLEGARENSRIGLRLGGPEMADNEFQHLGFFSQGVMHTTYGEFLNRQSLERMGSSTWIPARPLEASNINGTWIASSSDARTRPGAPARSYVTVLRLEVAEGNQLTGSAHVLDEALGTEVNFLRADIVDGVITGSRLRLTLVNNRASFEWDLRLGQNRLAGAYRRLDPQGEPFSVGNAVFYRSGTPALEGTWTAAFADRINEVRAPETQLAIVQITGQTAEGVLSGTGRLQYAAEIDDLERVFSVSGEILQNHPSGPWIQWTWSGNDLAGDTVWNLRQQSNIMVGSYTNYTANGNLESRGHAVWYR